MQYAVVHNLKSKPSWLEEFRKKLDPQVSLLGAHFTLVFPFEMDAQMLPKVQDNIRSVVERWSAIKVKVGKIELQNGYVFLLPIAGGEPLELLHDELYASDNLREFLDPDRSYFAHITIGRYSTDSKPSADLAARKASEADVSFEVLVNNIELIEISPGFSKVSVVESYRLVSD